MHDARELSSIDGSANRRAGKFEGSLVYNSCRIIPRRSGCRRDRGRRSSWWARYRCRVDSTRLHDRGARESSINFIRRRAAHSRPELANPWARLCRSILAILKYVQRVYKKEHISAYYLDRVINKNLQHGSLSCKPIRQEVATSS
jgi:hypothetical protein